MMTKYAYSSLLVIFITIVNLSYAQVDVTKYATGDLFEVKPLITQENVELIKIEEDETHTQIEEEVNIGMKLWNDGEIEEAIYHFEQLSDEYQAPLFEYYLGMINYQSDNNEAAITHFETVLERDPLFLESK